jgi:hypothetical protein
MFGETINTQPEYYYVVEVNGKLVCWHLQTTSLHVTDFLNFCIFEFCLSLESCLAISEDSIFSTNILVQKYTHMCKNVHKIHLQQKKENK